MRIIDHQKTMFFTDNLDSIDMAQIQNIEKVQDGILPSLLGYGNIRILLTASDSIKTFHHVPNAKFHFRCLNRQKEIRQRSVLRGRRRPQDFSTPQFQTQKVIYNPPAEEIEQAKI